MRAVYRRTQELLEKSAGILTSKVVLGSAKKKWTTSISVMALTPVERLCSGRCALRNRLLDGVRLRQESVTPHEMFINRPTRNC